MKGLIFTYALTYGGAAASLMNPFYGLLIYVCFSIIRPESLWHWSVPAGNYSRVIAMALLFGWGCHGFGRWNLGPARHPIICLIGFWVWSAISSLQAADSGLAWGFLEAKAKIILPVVVGISLIETVKQLRQLAWTIAISMGYVAFDLNVSYYDGFNRLELVGFGGMDNNSMTIALVTGVGICFFLGLSTKNLLARLLAWGCAALMTHAVFFSFSRGGMVALICVGMVTFFLLPKSPEFYGLAALGVVLSLLMAGSEVRQEFASSFGDSKEIDWSAESRKHLWGIALQMTAESPLLGVGPDHYPHHVHEYRINSSVKSHFAQGKECHSLWLQQMAETGIPGVTFLFLYYWLTCYRLYRNRDYWNLQEDGFLRFFPGLTFPSLAGFAVASQFVSLEGLELPYYIALLGLGGLKIAHASQVVEHHADVWTESEHYDHHHPHSLVSGA